MVLRFALHNVFLQFEYSREFDSECFLAETTCTKQSAICLEHSVFGKFVLDKADLHAAERVVVGEAS
jgi:hypothetical protein